MPAVPPPNRSTNAPQVSLVIPTLNEAPNLEALLARIDRAMHGYTYEVVVVDDRSTDGTAAVCAQLSTRYPLTLLIRDVPAGGLSGAVLHGFARARGSILAVMDADLQHPPEALPALIAPLASGQADFVLGSRYAPGGAIASEWALPRRLMSHAARLLCRPLIGPIADPMSGFFALPRAAYERAVGLDPIGYKIALELLCKCPVQRAVEVPISFAARTRGRSKLSARQQLHYLRHLWRLYHHAVRS